MERSDISYKAELISNPERVRDLNYISIESRFRGNDTVVPFLGLKISSNCPVGHKHLHQNLGRNTETSKNIPASHRTNRGADRNRNAEKGSTRSR
jgi:hypothetical protein